MQRNHGFTLIEVIVTLMLVSVLATAAGFGLVEVARGYQAARENGRVAQTAQIALLRISRELMGLESVAGAGNSAIIIANPNGNRAIGRFGTEIRLDEDTTAVDGEVLIDRVTAFQISYEDPNNQPWNAAMPVNQLAVIAIQLSLSRSDGLDPVTFDTRINPRNNGTPNAPY